jgi:hypothetical protein
MEPVYVATNPHEKAMQRALIQYRNPKNYDLVYEALMKAGRQDLIGYDKKCLIRPRRYGGSGSRTASGGTNRNAEYRKNASSSKKGSEQKRKKKTIRNVHKKKDKN